MSPERASGGSILLHRSRRARRSRRNAHSPVRTRPEEDDLPWSSRWLRQITRLGKVPPFAREAGHTAQLRCNERCLAGRWQRADRENRAGRSRVEPVTSSVSGKNQSRGSGWHRSFPQANGRSGVSGRDRPYP
jgi:hypothetical protein